MDLFAVTLDVDDATVHPSPCRPKLRRRLVGGGAGRTRSRTLKALSLVIMSLMVLSGTVTPVASLGGLGLLNSHPATLSANNLTGATPQSSAASEDVLAADVVAVPSGVSGCAGGCASSGPAYLIATQLVHGFASVGRLAAAGGGVLLSWFESASTWARVVGQGLYATLTSSQPSAAPMLTTVAPGAGVNPIPPNSTAGYVENTLLLSNDTLLLGNVPDPFNGAEPPAAPESVTTDPSTGAIYVAGVTGASNTTVFEISPTTDRVVRSTTLVPSADTQCGFYGPALAFDPANGYLYVTSSACPNPVVVVFDPNNDTVLKSIALPNNFGAVALSYDPSSKEVYVTGNSFSSEDVVIINATSNTIAASIDSLGGCWTFAPVYDANDGLMFVTTWFCGASLAVGYADMFGISSTNAVVAKIPVPDENIGVSSVGAGTAEATPGGTIYIEENSAYTAGSNGVIYYPVDVVDPQANTTSVIEVPCGYRYITSTCSPVGLAFDQVNGYLYSAASVGSYPQNVSAIDPGTGKVTGFLLTGRQALLDLAYSSGEPRELAFDQSNNQVYDVSGGSGIVSVIYDARFNVTFTESGLPSGARWGMVAAGTQPRYTTGTTITYSASDGHYVFSVTGSGTYCAASPSTTVAVNGSDVSQTVQFSSSCDKLTFTQSGLPAGERWGVALGGFTLQNSTSTSLSFSESNDNYTYTVYPGYYMTLLGDIEYCVAPASGVADVNSTSVSVPLSFYVCSADGNVSVQTSKGFYSGTQVVSVNGTVTPSCLGCTSANYTTQALVTLANPLHASVFSEPVSVTANTGAFSLNFTTGGSSAWIGGTYTITVDWPAGPGCAVPNSDCYIDSGTVQFGYLPSGPTYQVTFVEGGLPQGTTWSVDFANVTKSSTSTTIAYSFPDGYYPYTVEGTGPYVPQIPAGTNMQLVNGSGVTEDIGFTYSEQLLLQNGTLYPGSVLTSNSYTNQRISELAYDPVNGLVYALGSNLSTVLGINATTKSVSQRIDLQGRIGTITVDPSDGYLFVTNSSNYLETTVTVIDPMANSIVAVTPLQVPAPDFIESFLARGFAVPAGNFYALAEVTSETGTLSEQVVYAVSASTYKVESSFIANNETSCAVACRYLSLMAIDEETGAVYLAGRFENSTMTGASVLAVLPPTWAVVVNATLSVTNLNSIAVDSQNGLAYLASGSYFGGECDGSGASGLYAFDANTSVATPVGKMGCAAALTFDPVNGYLYVSDPTANGAFAGAIRLSALDPATGAAVANITEGLTSGENSITAVDTTNGDVYASSPGSYEVSVVSGKSNTVTDDILLGATPGSTVYASDGYVFVADQGTSNLWVLNATTGLVEGNYPLPTISIGGMAYDQSNGYLYVVSTQQPALITIFDPADGAVVTSIPVSGATLVSAAYDPLSNRVFVTGNDFGGAFALAVDPTTETIAGNVSLGSRATATGAIVFDPLTGYLYALGGEETAESGGPGAYQQVSGSDRLYIINGSSDAIVANVTMPLADALAVNPDTGVVYAVGAGVSSTTIATFELATINATTGAIASVAPVPCAPSGSIVGTCDTKSAVYDPANNIVYIPITEGASAYGFLNPSPVLASYDAATGVAGLVYGGSFFFPGSPGLNGNLQSIVYDPLTEELYTGSTYTAGYSCYYGTCVGALSIIRPLNVTFVTTSQASSLQVDAVLQNGSPAADVSILVAGLQATTGGGGSLLFTGLASGATESVQACISGLCTTKTVTLSSGTNVITFPIQYVHADVVNLQGNPVLGVQLTYSGSGGIAGAFVTNSTGAAQPVLAPSGAELSISTSLYGTGLPYATPPVETFTVNGTAPVIRLEPLPTGTLQGLVAYSNGTLVANTRVTVIEQINGATFTKQALTNSTGGYSTTFYAGSATVSATSPFYLSSAPEYASIPQNGVETLNITIPLTFKGYINLQLYTQYLGGALVGPLPVDWRVGAHYSIHAIDPQGNYYYVSSATLPSGQLQENVIPVTGRPGEPFTVCADGYEADLPAECVSVTLDAYRNATAVIRLIQPGMLTGTIVDAATGSPVSSWSADVYSLNATGYATSVAEIQNSTSSLAYGLPYAGVFRLVIFGQSGTTSLWGETTVNASAAQVYQLGSIPLYEGAGDLFTGKPGNSIAAVPGETTPGGSVFLRASYNYSGPITLENVSILVPVPEGTTAIPGGFLLNDQPVNASSSTPGYYSVSVGNLSSGASGAVRYELQVSAGYDGSSMALVSLVRYFAEGTAYEEALSSTVETVEQVTLSAPPLLADLNTTVSGQAPPGSALVVYSNDTLLGTAVVPAGGFWQMAVSLPPGADQTVYQLHAIANTTTGVELYSPVIAVTYDNTQPVLVKICMQQTDGRLVCWDPQEGIPHFPYVFVPGMAMTFTMWFSNASLVTDVEVIAPGAGSANATLTSSGAYTATFYPQSGWNGALYVNFATLVTPLGDGTLTPPSAQQAQSEIPSPFEGANVTLNSQSVTNITGTTTTSAQLNLTLRFNKEIPGVANGTALNALVGMNLTRDVYYTPNAVDKQFLLSTGYPIFNFTYALLENTSSTVEVRMSFFVPYLALPTSIAKEVDSPTDYLLPGFGTVVTIVDKFAGEEGGRLAPGAGAILSAAGFYTDTKWFVDTLESIGTVEACVSASGQGGFLTDLKLATVTAATALVGAMADGNDAAGVISSLAELSGLPVTFLFSLLSGLAGMGLTGAENYVSQEVAGLTAEYCPPKTANVVPTVDPSGVVYAGLLSNPVANATVTVFQYNSTTSQWAPWPAAGFGQLNPQQTGPLGSYAWFVPAGKYMVVVQAPGYSTERSIVVYVPPPATGINIDLPPSSPPAVSGVSAFSNSTGSFIELSFDQLMQAASLNGTTITVSTGGESLAGKVLPVDPQDSPSGTPLTSEAVFIPSAPLASGASFTVLVSPSVENYANMTMGSSYQSTVGLKASTYSLATDATDLATGENVNATAATDDPLAKSVQFTWVSPSGEPVASSSSLLAVGSASSSFTPTQSGTWVVEASFTDGTSVIETLNSTFYVVQPSPFTELFVTAVANSTGDASVNDALANGVDVTLTGVAPGTSVSVNAFDYAAAPPGTATGLSAQTGATPLAYFDLSVAGAPSGTAAVCFTSSGITSSTLLYYYSPGTGEWVEVAALTFVSPDTICGSVPVAELRGTPFAAAQPPSTPPPPPPPVAFAFTLAVSPSSSAVAQGGTAVASAVISLTSGSAQTVYLTTSGAPSGASAVLSAPSCLPSCTSTLSIYTSASTPVGSYSIVVTANGGGQTETATFTLTVTPSTTTTTTTTTSVSAAQTTTTTSTSTTTSVTSTATSTTTSSTTTSASTTASSATTATSHQTTSASSAASQTTALPATRAGYGALAGAIAVVLIAVVGVAMLAVRKRRAWWH